MNNLILQENETNEADKLICLSLQPTTHLNSKRKEILKINRYKNDYHKAA